MAATPPHALRPRPRRVGTATGGRRLGWLKGWGWPEWAVVAQVLFPALMFVPGLTRIRTVTRVASFALALIAWAWIFAAGRRAAGRPFPAVPWMAACAAWLVLSIANPGTNSPISGAAQAMLVVAIFSPTFWATTAAMPAQRLTRLLALLFACNAASALMGLAQFYRPDIFNPPVIPVAEMQGQDFIESMKYTTADGRKVLRPCGLTDTPGAASVAGMVTALLGLSWALRPSAAWKRAGNLALALIGIAVIYLGQARVWLLTLGVCVAAMGALFVLQGNFRRAATLGTATALAFAGSLAWVLRNGGQEVIRRFAALLADDPTTVYNSNRGLFLQEAFGDQLWSYPLGAGLGRWGQTYTYFGDHSYRFGQNHGELWVEIQWSAWIIDGGLLLLVGYIGGIAAAIWASVRVSRTCPDPEVAFWATIICALSLSIVVGTFGFIPFIGPMGIQFWLLLAVLHAADQQARARARATRRAV